ncbi:MAG: bifunctional diaminohydroxyphosphoribosylaminopyrimidine deaminase/5-amino-6-(5-phosphoribosylamino)uracil reductase RibD [Candidatus Magnetomorum sp.]|nr:bifunctional diaminohydroxyphosphoribosylaminopyrimidine deaminase/5-amino-6-(5-phosphoribosylamino)uracil reductase RibD [Candidatus Magnetomorum sp.]
MNHEPFMKQALTLAEKGAGRVSPNPMVGAIVVKDGTVVGKGYHMAHGGPHAEVNALNDAGKNAKNATIYVTLEPCNHTGKTPPCTHKILEAGIHTVVMAMKDPNPHVNGGGADYLRNKGVTVIEGICKHDARLLNASFLKYIKTGQPLVTMKYAATMDGRIATQSGDARWISSETSRHYVHQLRHANDAILVGLGTVQADDPSLTTRLPEEEQGVDPTRFIVDTHLDIDINANVLHLDSNKETILVCSKQASENRKTIFQKEGVRVLEISTQNQRIDLEALMIAIGKMKMTGVLIEGGSRIHASAVQSGIVDRVCCFIAPKILGGDGIPVCQGPSSLFMKDAFPVKNIQIKRFDDDIMIQGDLSNHYME